MADAYITGLRMLARRELTEAQLRARLERRQFEPDAIDAAATRLRTEGALDDRRTALACARTEVRVKRRGRLRVLRQLEALGVAPAVARAAVAEVFAEVDEASLLDQMLDRRLRRGTSVDQSTLRRVRRYLLTQGFEVSQVAAALRDRVRNTRHED